jgi:hypothetical protein
MVLVDDARDAFGARSRHGEGCSFSSSWMTDGSYGPAEHSEVTPVQHSLVSRDSPAPNQ